VTPPSTITTDRLAPGASDRLARLLRAAVPTVAPALVVTIIEGGREVFEMAVGDIAAEDGALPATPGTLFDLASLTKLFTTTAFLRSVSERRVDIDAPAVSIIQELGSGGPRSVDGGEEPLSRRQLPTPPDRSGQTVDPGVVTFRQLLTHTSGLAPWRAVFRVAGPVPPPDGADPASRRQRWAAGLDHVCRSSFVARPGSEVHYSDLGFMLLGEAVSRSSGGPLEDALMQRVLEPLGLASVTWLPTQNGRPRTVIAPTSFDDDWRHRRLWGEVEDENAAGLGGISGHAGLFATAGDVARLGQAWVTRDPRLGIDPAVATEATSDQTPGLGEARGLGWRVQPCDDLAPLGPRAYGHTGFTGTSLAVDPDRALVVALLTDRVYGGRSHPGIEALRAAVHETVVTLA
jgi:CubicO group peptidase (beta-lactamase class C family)